MPATITIDERFISGRVVLRRCVPADATAEYLGWLQDPVVNRYLETRWQEQTLDGICAFVAAMLASSDSVLFAITCDGRHVGNAKLGPVQGRHACADLSYFIGARDCWGQGLATEAIRALCQVGFVRLGLHRLQAGLYAGNVGSGRALEKAGFTREGVWRRQLAGPDGWEDHVFYGLLREEWVAGDPPRSAGNAALSGGGR